MINNYLLPRDQMIKEMNESKIKNLTKWIIIFFYFDLLIYRLKTEFFI